MRVSFPFVFLFCFERDELVFTPLFFVLILHFSIDDQLRVKLADSSLSRDLFPGDYSCLGDSENRPVKWMALEVLQKKIFTEASDTWAFGVLMWELCTLALPPYQEVAEDDMEQFLRNGYRLAQPINCPDELLVFIFIFFTFHSQSGKN